MKHIQPHFKETWRALPSNISRIGITSRCRCTNLIKVVVEARRMKNMHQLISTFPNTKRIHEMRKKNDERIKRACNFSMDDLKVSNKMYRMECLKFSHSMVVVHLPFLLFPSSLIPMKLIKLQYRKSKLLLYYIGPKWNCIYIVRTNFGCTLPIVSQKPLNVNHD